jgi:hypothetical protein
MSQFSKIIFNRQDAKVAKKRTMNQERKLGVLGVLAVRIDLYG